MLKANCFTLGGNFSFFYSSEYYNLGLEKLWFGSAENGGGSQSSTSHYFRIQFSNTTGLCLPPYRFREEPEICPVPGGATGSRGGGQEAAAAAAPEQRQLGLYSAGACTYMGGGAVDFFYFVGIRKVSSSVVFNLLKNPYSSYENDTFVLQNT